MKTIDSRGLRTTIYKVDDLAEAKTWYAKAFGTNPYFDKPFYVGFNIGGYELGLLPEKVNGPKTSNVLAYWDVEDIVDAYDIMISHGAKELETPNDVGEGIMVALVKDPWGNVIGLIQNPYFKPMMPDETIVEWAPFTLKEGISEETLLEISNRLEKEFLIHQNGFIRRELLRKSDDHWVDLIYWSSEKDAKAAFEKAPANKTAQEYFQIINAEISQVSHYSINNTDSVLP